MRRNALPGTMKGVLLSFIVFSIGLHACSVVSRSARAGDSRYNIHDKEGNSYNVAIMADGKYWMTENMRMKMPESYCYDSLQLNCDRYGRLYTWKSATSVCDQLGEGWRLPTDDDWRGLASQYGGVGSDSNDNGHAAYKALIKGGQSPFNAVLSGGRSPKGEYRRIDAHGFYWTLTGISDTTACFYNFGHGRPALYRQNEGDKGDAFAVRCVKESEIMKQP